MRTAGAGAWETSGAWQSWGSRIFPSVLLPGDGALLGLLRQLLWLSSLQMQHLSILFIKDLVEDFEPFAKIKFLDYHWLSLTHILTVSYPHK